jgi:hypothetical protein
VFLMKQMVHIPSNTQQYNITQWNNETEFPEIIKRMFLEHLHKIWGTALCWCIRSGPMNFSLRLNVGVLMWYGWCSFVNEVGASLMWLRRCKEARKIIKGCRQKGFFSGFLRAYSEFSLTAEGDVQKKICYLRNSRSCRELLVVPQSYKSRGSSVSIVSDYRLADRCLIPDKGRTFFF